MWHVIVLILKIIGITLLAILGLLILMLLLGLLVPVRYQIDARKQEELWLRAKVSWLLRIFCVPIVYEKGELSVRIKIFGIPIKDLTADSREVKKESRKLAKDAKKGAEEVSDAAAEAGEGLDGAAKAGEVPDGAMEAREGLDGAAKAGEAPDSTEKAVNILDAAVEKEASPSGIERQISHKAEEEAPVTGKTEEPVPKAEKKKKFILWRILSAFLEKLKKLKYTILSICGKIRKGLEKAGDIKEFLMLDSTKAALSLCKGQIFYLLKKLGPRRIRGWIHFGMEDPALTGQILGGIGVLYAYLPKKLELQPDFQQAVLEGELHIRGHFRGITLVGVAWRLWRDKNIKTVYKKIRSGF